MIYLLFDRTKTILVVKMNEFITRQKIINLLLIILNNLLPMTNLSFKNILVEKAFLINKYYIS